ncbi:MAG: carbon storage regulator CsrA [Candidatus Gastranaerophilales bacterium]|nr:carbon storage regulator CsrA [Candidatus Gastranaerophilales bacterium]
MLVLSRKTGQKIIINDDIEVVVLEVKGDTVKLGIEAPRNVTIYRHEIYEEIKQENLKTANQTSLDDISVAIDMLKTGLKINDSMSDKLNKITVKKPKDE